MKSWFVKESAANLGVKKYLKMNTATKTSGLVGEHFFSMVKNLAQKKATEANQSNIEIRAGENHWEHYEKRKRAKKHALITVEDTSKDGMN